MHKAFTNEWAVRVAGGSVVEADRIATKYGYTNLGRHCDNHLHIIYHWNNSRFPNYHQ
uniref:S8_pro-domain domain-containing protein n=1 Tax=Heterorhabditis bacteriophora TaxID=37862 RepID=A0A1I7WCN7_HETBA